MKIIVLTLAALAILASIPAFAEANAGCTEPGGYLHVHACEACMDAGVNPTACLKLFTPQPKK